VLLAGPRYLMRGLSYPARWFTEFQERHAVVLRTYDALTTPDGLIGVRPVFLWTSSFFPQFGLSFFDERLPGPGRSFHATLATGGPGLVFASVQLRPTHISRRVQLVLDATYDRRNDRVFNQIGSTAPRPPGTLPEARYAADAFFTRADLRYAPWRYLAIGGGGGFGLKRFGNGHPVNGDRPIDEVYCIRLLDLRCIPGTVDPLLVPGFDIGTTFLRANAEIRVDTRDSPIRTASGVYLALDADYTWGLGNDPSNYFRLHGEGAVAINLWQRSRVLVLRAWADLIAPLGDGFVPFSELAKLGGPDTLRGFRIDQFLGYSSLLVSAEYRWPIWMWMDGTLFVDYGGVFGRWFAGFGAPQMQPDVGMGVRVRTSDRFYFRFQFAHGFGDGWQVFLAWTNRP
jgi:hypothetical protein